MKTAKRFLELVLTLALCLVPMRFMTAGAVILTLRFIDDDNSAPIQGASVTMTGNGVNETKISDLNGFVVFDLVYGIYTKTVTHRDYDTITADYDVKPPDTYEQISLTKSRSLVVSGRVIDAETDDGIANAEVIIINDISRHISWTNPAGGFTAAGVTGGRSYSVTITADGYATLEDTITVERDDIDDLLYKMIPLYDVEGVVVDSTTSQPILGAEVALDGYGPEPTDGDGKFKLFDVPYDTDTYTLTVTKQGYQSYSETVAINKDNNNLGTIQITPSSSTGGGTGTGGTTGSTGSTATTSGSRSSSGGSGGTTSTPSTSKNTVTPQQIGDYSWRVDLPVLGYVEASVDGVPLVKGEDCIVKSGSTILTLTDSYVNSLRSGNHTLRMEFLSATATIDFTVTPTGTGGGDVGEPNAPALTSSTNDTMNPSTGGVEAAGSIAVLLAVVGLWAVAPRKMGK